VKFTDGSGYGLVINIDCGFYREEGLYEVYERLIERTTGELVEVSEGSDAIVVTGISPQKYFSGVSVVEKRKPLDLYKKSTRGRQAFVDSAGYRCKAFDGRQAWSYGGDFDGDFDGAYQDELIRLDPDVDEYIDSNGNLHRRVPPTHFPGEAYEWDVTWEDGRRFFIGQHGAIRDLPDGQTPIWDETAKWLAWRYRHRYRTPKKLKR
jgi:hypothetical protein